MGSIQGMDEGEDGKAGGRHGVDVTRSRRVSENGTPSDTWSFVVKLACSSPLQCLVKMAPVVAKLYCT